MTLSQTQLDNTSAAAFDVRLRFFADGHGFWGRSDLADYAADGVPSGWSVTGDAITTAGTWQEISDLVAGDGQFVYEWAQDAGQMVWSASLHGQGYDAGLLGAGKTVLAMRRMTRPAPALSLAYDSGWVLWWIGVVQAGGWRDDYRKGGQWQRTVRSTEATLGLTDAPRLIIGRLRIEDGASVAASSTLATPAAEAGNGEFVGSLANVDAGNVVDGRINTVWISQDPPVTTGETQAGSGLVVDEVFFKPLAGYAANRAWWVELLNASAVEIELGSQGGLRTRYGLYVRNAAGQTVVMPFVADANTSLQIAAGERVVICGDLATFNALTGGANGCRHVIEAKIKESWVADASGYPTATAADMDLHATDGFVIVGTPWDDIHWGSYFDGMKYGTVTLPWGAWTGAGVSLAALQPGQSLRRSPTGTNTNTAADWIVDAYPHPGDKWTPNTPQWVRVELREHPSTLSADVAVGATALPIDEGTTGWPGSGTGVIEGDAFSYTGRAANSLTGVTGLDQAHLKGATVYPTRTDGQAMTGWRVLSARVKRLAGRSKIKRLRAYTSAFAGCRGPGEEGWGDDYDPAVIVISNGTTADNAVSDIGLPIVKPKDDSIWLRTLLVFIDEMWAEPGVPGEPSSGLLGRAKVNSIEFEPDQLTVNASGLADIENARCVDVARYLVANYTWLANAALVTDGTPAGWGQVGDLATGIAAIPTVLADLCRASGCVAIWTRAGRLRIEANPWWPGGAGADTTLTTQMTLDEGTIRGELGVQDAPLPITGLALSAQDGRGNPLPRFVVPPGATGSGVVEVQGVTVANEGAVGPLAWNLYWQARNTRRIAGLTLTGIGEWCAPRQRVGLEWGDDNQGQWIVERVTQSWAASDAGRDWRTALDLCKFFVG